MHAGKMPQHKSTPNPPLNSTTPFRAGFNEIKESSNHFNAADEKRRHKSWNCLQSSWSQLQLWREITNTNANYKDPTAMNTLVDPKARIRPSYHESTSYTQKRARTDSKDRKISGEAEEALCTAA
jgi:hypothetical protein